MSDEPHNGVKKRASIDANSGFVLAPTLTPASVYDTTYLPYLTMAIYHTKDPIKKVYANKKILQGSPKELLYI